VSGAEAEAEVRIASLVVTGLLVTSIVPSSNADWRDDLRRDQLRVQRKWAECHDAMSRLRVGMWVHEVTKVLGVDHPFTISELREVRPCAPHDVHTITTEAGRHEEWIFLVGSSIYHLHFEHGKLTAIQD
jgi:hypothetical protein